MAKSAVFNIALVVLACMVIAAPYAEAAVTCGQVTGSLAPCLNYLRGVGPLPATCCGGVKSLNAAAKTPADRKAACGCIKQVAAGVPGIQPNLASGLPGKCGVSIGYPISLNVDCSKVN